MYPRIHARGVDARDWLSGYYRAYVERDVREVRHIGDLDAFQRFVRLCAGRTGQVLNLSSLAADCGISPTTARQWLEEIVHHALRGPIFETFVLSELYKAFANLGEVPPLYFCRDQTGHEVDLVIDAGTRLIPVEIKSAETLSDGLTVRAWYTCS